MSAITTDPVADMLARIRNAMLVHKQEVSMPTSKTKVAVAKLLKENEFILDFTSETVENHENLVLTLGDDDGYAKVQNLKKVSKPGGRVYLGSKDIPKIRRGRGLVIMSTSQGLMSGKKAAKAGIGGEHICTVY